MSLNIICLKHVPFEGPAAISSWAKESGHKLKIIEVYQEDIKVDVADVDLLIVLGGPMSANDEGKYPWLSPELQFIEEIIDAGKALLGICLGAQLIARALGARVYSASEKEIGWFPVESTEPDAAAFKFPEEFIAYHWHSETFDLPEGAVCLARTEPCPNQAFQYRKNVIGLQFHLEAKKELISDLGEHCAANIGDGTYQQSVEEMLDCEQYLKPSHELLNRVLDFLVSNT